MENPTNNEVYMAIIEGYREILHGYRTIAAANWAATQPRIEITDSSLQSANTDLRLQLEEQCAHSDELEKERLSLEASLQEVGAQLEDANRHNKLLDQAVSELRKELEEVRADNQQYFEAPDTGLVTVNMLNHFATRMKNCESDVEIEGFERSAVNLMHGAAQTIKDRVQQIQDLQKKLRELEKERINGPRDNDRTSPAQDGDSGGGMPPDEPL